MKKPVGRRAKKQTSVSLAPFTVQQLRRLTNRLGMSQSAVIGLAVDRMAREELSKPEGEEGGEGGEQ
jgi:hypothetical protein